ncbi:hypothetical protein [Chlorobium sp. N1]|uniref:hypothetical protein n=1 Tax=Chlorobium sp. N1 TaxID=2491138 RepID=UPI00103DD030|nr:hypothetical protein [Chlorobium sp. N1]TCD48580.1 hypothetical protein E0L29_01500 [Chlorobium sp. N1]
MAEAFQYPMTYPAVWLDYYYYGTWFLSMFLLALGWGLFFRYGRFTYAINLGCFWKTAMMLMLFVVTLGLPMYYNTKFSAEHGQDGDSVRIEGERMQYLDRKGRVVSFPLSEIRAIRQEAVTYNPPPKIFIVAETPTGRDSVYVTEKLPDYRRFLDELSSRSGVKAELR